MYCVWLAAARMERPPASLTNTEVYVVERYRQLKSGMWKLSYVLPPGDVSRSQSAPDVVHFQEKCRELETMILLLHLFFILPCFEHRLELILHAVFTN